MIAAHHLLLATLHCLPPWCSVCVQSQLALQCDRKTDAGLKESAKFFQVCVQAGGWWSPLCVRCPPGQCRVAVAGGREQPSTQLFSADSQGQICL